MYIDVYSTLEMLIMQVIGDYAMIVKSHNFNFFLHS